VGLELGERLGDGVDQGVESSRGGFSKQGFQLGEELLDRIEIGTVGRQIKKARPGFFDGGSDAGDLVARQVVHDDEIAVLQGWREELLHPGAERFAVHWAIDHTRSGDTIMPQRADKGRRLPMTEGNVRDETFAARRASVKARHLGRRACLVDEDKTLRVQFGLPREPFLAGLCDISALLLGGAL
jgi:hypothetical protein